MQRTCVPAAASRRLSPPESRGRSGIPPGMPGQPSEMAVPQPRLLAAVPRATPSRGRAQPPTAARSGPKTAAARSCKQQLGFRPKALQCRDLAPGRRPPESCKQHLSSGASLDSGSTSAAQAPGFGILQTTTSWYPGGFCRITEIAPCSRPIRSTTCTACTGPSAGRCARSNGTCAWAGTPSRSIWRRRRKGPPSGSAKASSILSKPLSPNGWKRTPRLQRPVVEQRLRPLGYKGGHSVLRAYVHTVRPQLRPSRAFLRMEPPPGERFEVDWGHFGVLDCASDKRKLYAFALVEAHSRMLYLEFTHSQSFETFVRYHVHAFTALGGVAREIAYDNLATAVAEHDGRLVRFLPRFLAFAREYSFYPKACNVAAGWVCAAELLAPPGVHRSARCQPPGPAVALRNRQPAAAPRNSRAPHRPV